MTDPMDEHRPVLRSALEQLGRENGAPEGSWPEVVARAAGLRRRRARQRAAVAAAVVLIGAVVATVLSRRDDQPNPVRTVNGPASTDRGPQHAASTTVTSVPQSGPAPDQRRLNAVQMISTRVGLAVGDHGTILRTTDGGRHWPATTTCGGGFFCGAADLTYLDMVSGRVGFAGGPNVALRTTDGVHWAEYTTEPLVTVHFANPTVGWGVSRSGGSQHLVRTQDSGRTWSPNPTPSAPADVCFARPDVGWYVGAAAIYRTTDGGRTWKPSYRPPGWIPPEGDPPEDRVQCDKAGGAWVQFLTGVAVTGAQEGYLMYSTQDGGRSWNLVFAEHMVLHSILPAANGAPGGAHGPFSMIASDQAFAIGNSFMIDQAFGTMITRGSHLGPIRPIAPAAMVFEARGASFVDAHNGWVVGTSPRGAALIMATTDGGATFTRQL